MLFGFSPWDRLRGARLNWRWPVSARSIQPNSF
jgi:hypothetical protein